MSLGKPSMNFHKKGAERRAGGRKDARCESVSSHDVGCHRFAKPSAAHLGVIVKSRQALFTHSKKRAVSLSGLDDEDEVEVARG